MSMRIGGIVATARDTACLNQNTAVTESRTVTESMRLREPALLRPDRRNPCRDANVNRTSDARTGDAIVPARAWVQMEHDRRSNRVSHAQLSASAGRKSRIRFGSRRRAMREARRSGRRPASHRSAWIVGGKSLPDIRLHRDDERSAGCRRHPTRGAAVDDRRQRRRRGNRRERSEQTIGA